MELPPLYLDRDINGPLCKLLRDPNDPNRVVTNHGKTTLTTPDHVHLWRATQQRRVLVSHNARDFLLIHETWMMLSRLWQVDQPHAPILLLEQGPARPLHAAIEDLFHHEQVEPGSLWRWRATLGWRTRSPIIR